VLSGGIDLVIGYALRFAILIPAIVFHEVSHGYAALALGDDTAQRQKRLSLNPIRHIDPWGTLLMPALLLLVSGGSFAFGYARPVPVNPMGFRPDVDRRWGMMLVGLAGPLSNLAMAVVSAGLFRVLVLVGSANPTIAFIAILLQSFVYLNLILMIFNLVPIPPLDGSRVLPVILPAAARPAVYNLERYGFPIIFVILFVVPMLLRINPLGWLLSVTAIPLTQALTGMPLV
jgi:Zn-dependent protease